jgi:hypothetical protein
VRRSVVIRRANSKAPTSQALDVAARYFVYKIFDATREHAASSWQPVRHLGEAAATVSRAVERGWISIRHDGKGRARELWAALTEEGRAVARKGLR